MKRGLLIVLGLILLGIVTATAAMLYRTHHAPVVPGAALSTAADDGVVQTGDRIKVEVLNATPQRGLARRVTFLLRDAGFDVVSMGNASGVAESTVVLDRSRHPAWAKRVGEALGGVAVIERPDSSRYVDVTVLLGRRWRAPSEAFHP